MVGMIASGWKIVLEGISSVVVPSVALVERKMVAGTLVPSTGSSSKLFFDVWCSWWRCSRKMSLLWGRLRKVQPYNIYIPTSREGATK
jgi:hypothetical protein